MKLIANSTRLLSPFLLFFFSIHFSQGQTEQPVSATDTSQSQQPASTSKTAPGTKEEKEDIEDLSNSADEFYAAGLYKNALHLYLDLEKQWPENVLFKFRIGVCYLKTANRQKALEYIKRATELGVENEDLIDANYCFARAYHLNNEFDEAIKYYKIYIQKLHKEKDVKEIATIEHFIHMCDNGKKLVAHPVNVKVQHLDGNINSSFADLYPVISGDGSSLFFASRRHTSTGGKYDKVTNEYNEDIFISSLKDTSWTIATSISKNTNSIYDEAPLSISADGKKLYLYKSEKGASYDIWSSNLSNDNVWIAPEKLKHVLNSADFETGCSISADGQRIYFCSDRHEGYGGMDIYCSKLLPDGNWGAPINLGPSINTRFNDECPHILSDGRTLYFSSMGHNSMGGLDLFVSKLNGGKWSMAQNLGYPINTSADEGSITFTADMKYAYYSAVREDSYGDEDIYKISFGDYHIEDITPLVAEKTGHDTSTAAPSPILLHKGDILYYKAYFDFHSTALNDHAKEKVLKVVEMMKKYPNMTLLVCGHAGALGSEGAQLKISEERAKSVVDFMVAAGIGPDRLTSKGYGKAHLVDATTNRHGSLKSRSVEFVILNDFNGIASSTH